MKVSLVVMTAGKAAGQAIPITLSQFLIGRDPQCNLRPASALISKRHCAILVKGSKVAVRDFDSTNGTFVNEKPIKGEAGLTHEDVLRVGPLSFRVVIEVTPPVNKPTPPPPKLAPAATSDDESVAAMLLSLQDEGAAPPAGTGTAGGDVPAGSTVMDMIALTGVPKPGDANQDKKDEKGESKPGEKKDPKDPKAATPPPDTRAAAAAILEKYTRRQRG